MHNLNDLGNSHSVDIDAIAQSFGFSFALTGTSFFYSWFNQKICKSNKSYQI